MKTILISTLLTLMLQCNADISGSINKELPLNSLTRIPTPTQSLLPPTFENPIKDYTVGLVPPPIDGGQSSGRDDTRPKVQQHHTHSNPHTRVSGFMNTARPFENSVQQRSGYTTLHQKTHHPSNLMQPQVYQPKTAIYQPFQQFRAPHHTHHPPPTTYSSSTGRQPVAAVAQHHHHKQFQSAPQYHGPVTQKRVHQHSTRTHYVSIPVQRAAPVIVQHAHPSVHKSTLTLTPSSRRVSSSGASIQIYPSVSYTAIPHPQHGSTLNFGNSKFDSEFLQIISEVYNQNH